MTDVLTISNTNGDTRSSLLSKRNGVGARVVMRHERAAAAVRHRTLMPCAAHNNRAVLAPARLCQSVAPRAIVKPDARHLIMTIYIGEVSKAPALPAREHARS